MNFTGEAKQFALKLEAVFADRHDFQNIVDALCLALAFIADERLAGEVRHRFYSNIHERLDWMEFLHKEYRRYSSTAHLQ